MSRTDRKAILLYRSPLVRLALAFLASLAVTILLQGLYGAYGAEFTADPDEPSHYMTGLMVHDFLVSGWSRPMAFAQNYYAHYPKVALGHWPPFFYLIEAAWMLIFGVSRISVLLLEALFTSVFTTATFALIRNYVSEGTAWLALFVLCIAPPVHEQAMMVMTDIVVGVLVVAAIVLLSRYYETLRWGYSLAFALVAGLAFLTKGIAVLLAPIPLLYVLISRRFGLLRRWDFWLPLALVLAGCLPWYLRAPDALHQHGIVLGGIIFRPQRAFTAINYWWRALGPILLLSIWGAVGIAGRYRRKERVDSIWVLCLAVPVTGLIFRCLIEEWEPRHLIMSLPFLAMLAAWAWHAHAYYWRARPVVKIAAMAGFLLLPLYRVAHYPQKMRFGLDTVVSRLAENPQIAGKRVLIVSDSSGEGVFISEMAMRDRMRPSRTVLRGTKSLASLSWMGDHYQPRFQTESELSAWLASADAVVVIDAPLQEMPYANQVRLAVATGRGWKLLGAWPREQKSGATGKVQAWILEPSQPSA